MSEVAVEQTAEELAALWETPISGVERAAMWMRQHASLLPSMVSIYVLQKAGSVTVSLGTTYSSNPDGEFNQSILHLFAGRTARYTKKGQDETWKLYDESAGLAFEWHRWLPETKEATTQMEVVI